MSPLQPTFMLGRQEKSGRTGESGRRPRTVVEARLRPSPRDYSSPAARAGDRKRTTPNRTTQPRRLAPRPPQVAVQYNLANEPWDKFSMAAVADRGLKPQLWTSGRLRKEARERCEARETRSRQGIRCACACGGASLAQKGSRLGRHTGECAPGHASRHRSSSLILISSFF